MRMRCESDQHVLLMRDEGAQNRLARHSEARRGVARRVVTLDE